MPEKSAPDEQEIIRKIREIAGQSDEETGENSDADEEAEKETEKESNESDLESEFIDESEQFVPEPAAGAGSPMVFEPDKGGFAEQGIENLEQAAQLAPSSAARQQAGDDFGYDSGKEAGESYKEFSQYEQDQKKYSKEGQEGDVTRRDLFFDREIGREEIISPFSLAQMQRASGIQQPAQFQETGKEIDKESFERQLKEYQERLEQEATPAFRRGRRARGEIR